MNQASKLTTVIFALMIIGFIPSNAQAGDGLLARLRSKICKTKCPPAPTCEELCIQKVFETYCKRVRDLEKYRCTKPCAYKLGMYLAKTGYCLGVKECRNPCQVPTMAAPAPPECVPGTPEECALAYANCEASFAAWQNGHGPEPEPTTACIDYYFLCLCIQ